MTAKEKAMQLVTNFYIEIYFDFKNSVEWKKPNDELTSERTKKDAKRCALIAVEEIIKETMLHDLTIYQHGRTAYWQEVKQEIEKL